MLPLTTTRTSWLQLQEDKAPRESGKKRESSGELLAAASKAIMPATEAAALASKQPTVGRRANTAEETAAKIAETPHGMRIYTDGGVNRGAKTKVWGVAGYGATVLRLMKLLQQMAMRLSLKQWQTSLGL